jgi:hypothetical protein
MYLPARSMGICIAQVCRRTPKEKIATAMISDIRRPRRSPNGAANNAPKNVPALNIETICEDCDGDTLTSLSFRSM